MGIACLVSVSCAEKSNLISEEWCFTEYVICMFIFNFFNFCFLVNVIIYYWYHQFVARVIEEETFGVDNVCWISAKATLEASKRAEFLILQTGMTAFGKAYYRNQRDLVPNVHLRDLANKTLIYIYMCVCVCVCVWVLLLEQELFWSTYLFISNF